MSDSSAGAARRNLRVVLADDHVMVREGLKALINAQHDMNVVAEGSDGQAAWHAVKEYEPDIVVLDLSMPFVDGATAAERIRRDFPEVSILALTVHEERAYVTQLLRAGASGYVLKRAAAAELVRAIRVIATGGSYIDPSVSGSVVAAYLDADRDTTEAQADQLSERERQVVMRIARGFSNKEIAATLGLSVKTVETYKARVAEKLGLRTRVDIVQYAVSRGWLGEPSEPSDL